MPPLLFRSRFDLYERHHRRLATAPMPALAREQFERRLRRGERVQRIQLALYVFLYLSFVAAAASFVADRVGVLGPIATVLRRLAAIASSLTVLFLLGILVCRRYLSLIEIELHFYSQEARLAEPSPGPGFT